MVDSQAYLSTLRSLVEEGHEVSMVITGSSMSPFLVHGRDAVYFGKPHRPLRRGDIVCYRRSDGSFVVHRIYKVTSQGYYLIGDAQTVIEGPLSETQIFALVKKVRRKGQWLEPGCFWWEFFAHTWLSLIPLRRFILRMAQQIL